MSAISRDEVAHLADLAHIEMSEDELQSLAGEEATDCTIWPSSPASDCSSSSDISICARSARWATSSRVGAGAVRVGG
jgi:hypothetical protein